MRINDHIPVPVENPIIMTAAQFNDLQAHLTDLLSREQTPVPALDEAQFAKLCELLQPGFELSTMMLAEYKAKLGASNPTTRSIIAAGGAPEDEWRTPEEINMGVPFNADRSEVIADRAERQKEADDLRDRQESDVARDNQHRSGGRDFAEPGRGIF